MGQGLRIIEASRSRSDTAHSVGLLWASDQPDAETSTRQHTQETDIPTLGGIRTRNRSKRAAAYPRHRPHGHRGGNVDLQTIVITSNEYNFTDQMPPYLVLKQVYSMMASEFPTVYHAVW